MQPQYAALGRHGVSGHTLLNVFREGFGARPHPVALTALEWLAPADWKGMTEPGVIVRVLRAQIRPGRVAAFNAVFRKQVALIRQQPGILYVKLARRLDPDGGQEAVLFEEWADAASLYAWVGPNLTAPRLVPGARELIDSLSVSHFEVLPDDGITHGLSASLDQPMPGADEAGAVEAAADEVGAA